ncbi:MAG: threonine/serine dehydratase [Candidatus Aminicenantaceae bacterium]
MIHFNFKKEVLDADQRIRNHIRQTPLEYSFYLSRLGSCHVYLKLEIMQITNSFKLRGAMSKLYSLEKRELEQGVVTASSGNHGIAFAYVVKNLGCQGTVYLPKNTSSSKIEALKYYDVELKYYGYDCVQTEAFAKKTAVKNNQPYISPYNDQKVIGGQGTIALELTKQLNSIDAVLVPVGGGGLISGISGFLKSKNPNIKIIGCQPQNSAVMYESIKAGQIMDIQSIPTISGGTAGGIEPGAVTFDICKKHTDDFILVSEEKIKKAICTIAEKHFYLLEGAGALSVASFIKHKKKFANQTVVLILSGARISLKDLKNIL